MNNKTKDTLFYLTIFIIYFLIALIIGNIFNNKEKKVVAIPEFNTPAIIIDAGHGGEDGGAIAIDGKTLEKDINLSIAKKLNNIIKSNNINTFMIRDTDESIYKKDSNKKTLRRKKVEDLMNRFNISNSNDKNILICIHHNKFPDESLKGIQIFYSGNNENSIKLANFLKEELEKNLNTTYFRETKKSGKEVYLLNKVKVPAVIIECGFISNKEELNNLISEGYQSNLAQYIFLGLKKFLDANIKN